MWPQASSKIGAGWFLRFCYGSRTATAVSVGIRLYTYVLYVD